jgi:hypothetical protein
MHLFSLARKQTPLVRKTELDFPHVMFLTTIPQGKKKTTNLKCCHQF